MHNDLVKSQSLAIRRPQQPTKYQSEIINTLINVKNSGKVENTQRVIANGLRRISKGADLQNPEQVKTFIANCNLDPQSKNSLALAYNWYCKTNNIQWNKPYYKWERKIPLIPTAENINKIISASTTRYAAIFTILAETGLEAHELATMERKQIDTTQGIINARGCKGHNSRSFKLKPATAEMLRQYLADNDQETPFPSSRSMGEMWRRTRNRLAKKLNQSELKNIPMRNLRHHFATYKYDQTKDILLLKTLLGHKKLETTMFYVQLIAHDSDEEYTVKTASNVKEATDLIEHGFQYVTEIDNIKIFRKRK
jgi:integrase